jgi:hypothetical protein
MRESLLLFMSAAGDVRFERDVVARAVPEIPTTLGWTIRQTPSANRETDLRAVARADVHVLILGRDIQAPVGLEWQSARRAGRVVHLFAQDVVRTQAANGFMREVAKHGAWTTFENAIDLRRRVLEILGEHLLGRVEDYEIGSAEQEKLRAWRKSLALRKVDDARAADDSGGVILSVERFVPREGVLIKDVVTTQAIHFSNAKRAIPSPEGGKE